MSWYHAVADFGHRRRYFWNRDRDALLSELLIPLLSRQVVPTRRMGKKVLFNFGSVSYFTIIKTNRKLKRPREGEPPSELQDRKFVIKNNATEEFVNNIRSIQANPFTRSILQRALSKPQNQIFVIMKFDDEGLDSAFQRVIKPVSESFGYKVLRIDELQDSGHISAQVLEGVAFSQIVIAEMSGERPNCYYEAGFAHALGKEIVFLIRQGEPIHFDLSHYRFIQWKSERDLEKRLRQRLEAITSREEE